LLTLLIDSKYRVSINVKYRGIEYRRHNGIVRPLIVRRVGEQCIDGDGSQPHYCQSLLLSVQVFMHAFIPRKLNDVVDFERDLDRVREGIDTDLVSQ